MSLLSQSAQPTLNTNAYQMGAAVCVAGMSVLKAHLSQSGADMRILNPDTPYTQSVKTDISKIFRRAGWTPPSEDKEMQKKWEYYRTISIRNERKSK